MRTIAIRIAAVVLMTVGMRIAGANANLASVGPMGPTLAAGSLYTVGTAAQRTANANSGYGSRSWGGGASGASDPISSTMDGSQNVAATFRACPPITGWKGEYWANPELSGAPALCRNDAALDFDWGDGSPDPAIPPDFFSARWTRSLSLNAGTYRFDIMHDDGARFYIDNVPVLDNWCSECVVTDVVTRGLSAGSHDLKLEMYENSGAAGARLNWTAICYSLSTSVIPGGAGSIGVNPGPNCGSRYSAGTVVQLTANANSGYNFSSWSGDAGGASNPISITMNGDKNVTANLSGVCPPITDWKGEYWTNPELSGAPTFCWNDVALDFDWGTGSPDPAIPSDHFSARWTRSLSFEATTYRFSIFHDDGARFYIDNAPVLDNWCGDCSVTDVVTREMSAGSHALKLEMFENSGGAGARLNWTPTCHSIITNVSPSGAGSVSVNPGPNCGSRYSTGTVVQLTANANSGYSFSSWSGDAGGASNPTSITMDGSKTVTANYRQCYTLSTSVSPGGAGSVNVNPGPNCGSRYLAGTVVQLTANANAGYSFSSWSGGAGGASNPISITMNGDKDVTANYRPCYSLSTTASPNGAGSIGVNPGPNCGSRYSADTIVQLTANANAGYSFSSWSGGASGTSNPISITMNGTKTVTATFGACPPITGWKGEYWANPGLSGPPTLCRNDVAPDFDWGTGSPGPAIPSDHFSARWTRSLSFDAGAYRFEVRHDDGARFYIDNVLVLDNWCSGCAVTDVVTRELGAGNHHLRLEMYENVSTAVAQLNWIRVYLVRLPAVMR